MVEGALAGAVLGLGLFVLVRALFPARPGLVARLLALDAVREDAGGPRIQLVLPDEEVSAFRKGLGARLARLYGARGWEARSVKADLALLGRSFEAFLATKVLLAASGLLAFPILLGWLALMGWGVSFAVPFWSAVLVALLFFFLPDLQIRKEAAAMRRDFRHVVGAFLDLVSMNLAGGRGVPEALMMAVSVSGE
ncbi:MAG: type II secretion system protein, partial [Nonomuraea sp.]|nr:type II secretion system protein [Nonomuraea sp.]